MIVKIRQNTEMTYVPGEGLCAPFLEIPPSLMVLPFLKDSFSTMFSKVILKENLEPGLIVINNEHLLLK